MSLNDSEKKLGILARKTFLSMWSYENPFYEQGKELCDVLVVFENDVIIISDKMNKFGDHASPAVNWQRWYRKAVVASARQLCGARNHIRNFPEKIYIDAKASSSLPLKLPSSDLMKIHLIAVANGCEDACEASTGNRSLSIDTGIVSPDIPFAVGCLTEDNDFLHIISTPALDAMFDCFDTTRDFLDYLNRKRSAMFSERWRIRGEENFIAAYMTSQPGNNDFYVPVTSFCVNEDVRIVSSGLWDSYSVSKQRISRKNFWAKSYVIDQIVNEIAEDYAKKRMIVGQNQPVSYHEAAFRLLASESRLSRQALAGSFLDIYCEGTSTFWSVISESLDNPGVHYLWLLYPQPPDEVSLAEVEYYLDRELKKYLLVAQSKYRNARRIFGICLPNRDCKLTSRIFRLVDGEYWTNEMAAEANRLELEEGILSDIDTVIIGAVR